MPTCPKVGGPIIIHRRAVVRRGLGNTHHGFHKTRCRDAINAFVHTENPEKNAFCKHLKTMHLKNNSHFFDFFVRFDPFLATNIYKSGHVLLPSGKSSLKTSNKHKYKQL